MLLEKKTFKLVLSVPCGRTHKPRSLLDKADSGLWSGEIGNGLTASVACVGGQWRLTLTRGERSATFAPVVATPQPWEVVYWIETGWFPGGACELFLTR